MSPKKGRPFEDKARKGRLEIRTSEKEEEMLDFCVAQTGENRAEIIRQGIEAVYCHVKEQFGSFDENEGYGDFEEEFNENSNFKVNIICPHCDSNIRIRVSDYEVDCEPYDRGEDSMGEEYEHIVECDDFQCVSCGKEFKFSGSVWEYPTGTLNCKNIQCNALEDEEE